MYIMKKTEPGDSTVYYLSVESNYAFAKDGKGKDDAVLFELGQFNRKQEVDTGLTFSVEEAREFAKAILKQCDEIEG